jgi:hypothetical protein
MIYTQLIALAFLLILLGFLLHAIYSRAGVKRKLAAERDKLQKVIAEKQAERDAVHAEIAKKNVLLRDLEQMIGKRNNEIEALQSMALRQEEEINLLRQDAAAIRQAVVESEVAVFSRERLGTAYMNDADKPQIQRSFPMSGEKVFDGCNPSNERKNHGAFGDPGSEVSGKRVNWRENLTEILKSIDSVEVRKEE